MHLECETGQEGELTHANGLLTRLLKKSSTMSSKLVNMSASSVSGLGNLND